MNRNNSMRIWFLLLIIFVTVLSACNNEDKTETTVTDTTNSVMVLDSTNRMDTAVVPMTDTSTVISTTPTSATAKPNPAKKGMKGKVTVTPAPAAKADAKMEKDNTGVYDNVEYIPAFPGGTKGLQNYFDKNLVYPDEATNEGVEGTVYVTFVVDENGKLSSPQVAGNKLGYGLEEEAIRVISKMPVWTPGKLKGQNVKTRYTLPITFQLY